MVLGAWGGSELTKIKTYLDNKFLLDKKYFSAI